jgi:outer membrane protein insertion porin family
MALKEVSWLEKKFTKKEPFLYSGELMDLDLERLKRIYQSEGFIHVQTSLQPLNINEKKQTVKIKLRLQKENRLLPTVHHLQFQTVHLSWIRIHFSAKFPEN